MRLKFGSFLSLLLISLFTYSCSEDELDEPNPDDPMEEEATIWTGATTTFTKQNDADPSVEANQDRITDNVWITRGNEGGQIYNAKTENEADKMTSPTGTEWAEGTTDQIESLDFQPFREAVGKPQDVVGKDLVLHLIEDNIYLSVKFTSWTAQKGGGFAYERSTEN